MKKFEPKIEKQPVIREGLDRKGRFQKDGFPEGALPESDEDQELVNINNPSNKFVRSEDVADNSYLSYGEEGGEEAVVDDGEENAYNQLFDKDNHPLTDQEIEELAAIRENNRKDLGRDEFYTIKNLNPENSGKIGAANISVPDGEILINRESVKNKDLGLNINSPMTAEEKRILAEKYENLEEPVPSGKMRLEAYKDYMLHSNLDRRLNSRHGRSHPGDNLKTETTSKKERRHRSLLRDITETPLEDPYDKLNDHLN